MSSNEQLTLVRPAAPAPSARGFSSALPPDLLEQVRGRIALLALLMMIAFALDPLLYFGGRLVMRLNEGPLGHELLRDAPFYFADLGVVASSAAFWWVARTRRLRRGFSRWECCTRLRFASCSHSGRSGSTTVTRGSCPI